MGIISKNKKKDLHLTSITFVIFIFVYFESVLQIICDNFSFTISILSIIYATIFAILIDKLIKLITKYKFLILTIITSITAIFYMIEEYSYLMFNTYYTPSVIFGMSKDVVINYYSVIVNLVASKIYVLLLNIIPIILLIVLKKYIRFNKSNNKKNIKKNIYIISTVIIILLFTIVNKSRFVDYSFSDIVKKHGINVGLVFDFLNKFNKIEYNNRKAVELESISDVEYNVIPIDFDSINQQNSKNSTFVSINNYIKNVAPSNKNEYTGLFKNKNLILICAEAFSGYAVSEELTPTLYRLINKGFVFSDYYMPLSSISTTAGEFQFLMGLNPSFGEESMKKIIGHNNYFTIVNQLKREGYYTASFHDGRYDYYNRNLTHPSLGFDIFYGFGGGLDKYTLKRTDYELFDKTFPVYKDKTPFVAYYMTYDAHLPYYISDEVFKRYRSKVVDLYGVDIPYEEMVYYTKIASLDDVLKKLIENLSKEGILDDTVICLTADHYPYGLRDSSKKFVEDIYGFKFDDEELDKRDKNKAILWSTALEDDDFKLEKEITSVTSSLDLLPTLSNLFGLEFDSRYMVGRDVFSDAEPLVFWNNRSFKTNEVTYNSITNKYTYKDDIKIDENRLNEINNIVKDKINYSKQVIQIDYFDILDIDKINNKDSQNEDIEMQTKENAEEIDEIKTQATYDSISALMENISTVKGISNTTIDINNRNYQTVLVGKYEQDGIIENGEEPIEWYIVYADDKNVFLLSKYIIDAKPYNTINVSSDWNESYLKAFLNYEFYEKAFSAEEKEKIYNVAEEVDPSVNESMFILSKDDFDLFFNNNSILREDIISAVGTKYAKSNGLYIHEDSIEKYNGKSLYWARDKNIDFDNYNLLVEYNGFVSNYGALSTSEIYGVRPVMWLKLKNKIIYVPTKKESD